MSFDIGLSSQTLEKRPLSTITGNVDESPAKKVKGEIGDDIVKEGEENGSVAKCLTPEQKKRMAASQMQARMKLLCKQLPALHSSIGETWFSALEPEFRKDYFKKLSDFVAKERSKYTIYPPEDKVWTWTNACEFNKVKVVILGQDPYHGPRQAHGLCFSVQTGVPPPPSLVNIFKELKNDIPGFEIPKHGYLIGWARQGVLLLNACLTVRASSANSHKDQGWENLTDAVIKALNEKSSGLVFLLWGAYAEKKSVYVDKKKHHILKTVHPSPLSASRGFFGCKHFSRANELLKSQGKTQINWNDLPIE
ncbi:uracil-DNA glycosylase 2-like isoform X2 [Ischnura elegans]|uniref:uracil-DNA glycosylase 2-like isoform X2 n=1 Tax=Ischnura elegans TaxID=197161 RepID=UPI001ED88AE4|nr:uracil-DNA glycosylase 2-like isoform X2 [Ischnura elegans]